MIPCVASENLIHLKQRLDNTHPKLTFFGRRYVSNGEKLSKVIEKVNFCAYKWRELSCFDRLIGLELQRKIRGFYRQIEEDLPKYNFITRFFAYIRMFQLSFIGIRPGEGLYIFPNFTNTIDLFTRSIDWRSQANFCTFTEAQLRTNFPQLWTEWENGDQTKIKKEQDPFEEIYSLDPNWLFNKLQTTLTTQTNGS